MKPYFYYSEQAGREFMVESDGKREAVKDMIRKLKKVGLSPDKKEVKKEIFS
jgi:hypothetical protein